MYVYGESLHSKAFKMLCKIWLALLATKSQWNFSPDICLNFGMMQLIWSPHYAVEVEAVQKGATSPPVDLPYHDHLLTCLIMTTYVDLPYHASFEIAIITISKG